MKIIEVKKCSGCPSSEYDCEGWWCRELLRRVNKNTIEPDCPLPDAEAVDAFVGNEHAKEFSTMMRDAERWKKVVEVANCVKHNRECNIFKCPVEDICEGTLCIETLSLVNYILNKRGGN